MKKENASKVLMALSMFIFGTIAPLVRNIGVGSGELALYRAMMAAVLAQRAECLLLDEPTSALDVRHALNLTDYLRRLRSGCGILMVTHDLDLALRYADRVLLLRAGKVVASGSAAEVMTPENLERAYGCRAELLTGEHSRSVGFY